MNKPHKHAEVIKAWADGAQIEFRYSNGYLWRNIECPQWEERIEYRVKPEPKPDIVQYVRAMYGDACGVYVPRCMEQSNANIKVVFDGETHKLKSVELINKE